MAPRFRFLTQLNGAPPEVRGFRGRSHGFPTEVAKRYFGKDRLVDRTIRELLASRAMHYKEVLESFEFYGHARRPIRAGHVVDLCCGHGLVGTLFALFDRDVKRVTLLDSCIPKSLEQVLSVATRLGPWVSEKIRHHEADVGDAGRYITPGASIVAAHACGGLTDRCLQLAREHSAAVAVMPCCCHPVSPLAPKVLGRVLGTKLAVDVHRTYELTAAGHEVLWRYLPEEITPMNRIIIGKRPELSTIRSASGGSSRG